MKAILKISVACFLLSLGSCADFLEEEPKGKIGTEYLTTEKGMNDLLTSVYGSSRSVIQYLCDLGEMGTDLWTWAGSGDRDLTWYNTNNLPNKGCIKDFWRCLYEPINNINFGLSKIDNIPFASGKQKDSATGELHFFRAWYYYYIIETWGEGAHYVVDPLPVGSFTTTGNQKSIADFYKLILSDIDIAISKLPEPKSVTEYGRVHVAAAKTLKSRVLLALAGYNDYANKDVLTSLSDSRYPDTKAIYTEVKKLSDELIKDYSFRLLDNLDDIFDVYNEQNDEIIFSVQFTTNTSYNTGLSSDNQTYPHKYWVSPHTKSAVDLSKVPDSRGHTKMYGREWQKNMPTRWYLSRFGRFDKRFESTFLWAWCKLESDDDISVNYLNPSTVNVKCDTLLVRLPYKYEEDRKLKPYVINDIDDMYDPLTGLPKPNGRGCYNTLKKFLDPTRQIPKDERSYKDVIIFRLGEVYLNAAEAAWKLNDNSSSAKYLNDLRKRALVLGHEAEMNVAPTDLDLNFILDERALELGAEFIRWFDLKRTRTLVDRTLKYNSDAKSAAEGNPYGNGQLNEIHYVRPIPQYEMDNVTNKTEFKQNPGYPSK
ncbi:MAG: hypothetical protein RL662_425 [Bacteroidota bacterium]|jgi:hypothetical protein